LCGVCVGGVLRFFFDLWVGPSGGGEDCY
jgi:hypothetical protein